MLKHQLDTSMIFMLGLFAMRALYYGGIQQKILFIPEMFDRFSSFYDAILGKYKGKNIR